MDRNKLVGGLEDFLDQSINLGRGPIVALYAIDPGEEDKKDK